MQTKRRSTYQRIVLEEGIERGLMQGRNEGRHSAARELLLDLIRVRFGTCTPSVRNRIEAIQEEARLRELALAVVTVSSLHEFEGRIGT